MLYILYICIIFSWKAGYEDTVAVLLFLKSCLLQPFHYKSLTQHNPFPQFDLYNPTYPNSTIHPLFFFFYSPVILFSQCQVQFPKQVFTISCLDSCSSCLIEILSQFLSSSKASSSCSLNDICKLQIQS